jgi:tyrosyl-tRNA synthetase
MDIDKRLGLITRNLAEILAPKDGDVVLRKILAKRPLKIYWGTAPTGRIHIGYLLPMMKLADFLRAGCQVTILIADLHAMLDKMKSTPEQLADRTEYYELTIRGILTILGVDLQQENLHFVRGRSFQLTPEYTFDLLHQSGHISVRHAQKAGSEVVKQTDKAVVTDVIYPIMQVLDEKYLGVDVQMGGIDQRHIFTLSREMTHLKKKALFHFMGPLLPALSTEEPTAENTKMSSSSGVKIDLLFGKKAITKNFNAVYCLAGDKERNPVLDLAKQLVYPLLEYTKVPFVICRKEEYGGDISYSTYNDLETDFVENNLHPQDLKNGISLFFTNLLQPLRDVFDTKENRALLKSYA